MPEKVKRRTPWKDDPACLSFPVWCAPFSSTHGIIAVEKLSSTVSFLTFFFFHRFSHNKREGRHAFLLPSRSLLVPAQKIFYWSVRSTSKVGVSKRKWIEIRHLQPTLLSLGWWIESALFNTLLLLKSGHLTSPKWKFVLPLQLEQTMVENRFGLRPFFVIFPTHHNHHSVTLFSSSLGVGSFGLTSSWREQWCGHGGRMIVMRRMLFMPMLNGKRFVVRFMGVTSWRIDDKILIVKTLFH